MAKDRRLKVGNLVLDPAVSPGVLDTATWDAGSAWAQVQSVADDYWRVLRDAASIDAPLPPSPSGLTPSGPSCARRDGALYCLASLKDGQDVFLAIGAGAEKETLGAPIGIDPQTELAAYASDAPTIDRFCRTLVPGMGSRALGPIARLGVGTRMTTAVWPAIWQTMVDGPIATNAIQNSVRELNFLETLTSGRAAERNIAFGFGEIETGYTGSTYEGLWVSGVLDALKHGPQPSSYAARSQDAFQYGADADHIQVKRGPDGLAHAKRLLDATRFYSFFTLDVSDVLDYAAMWVDAAEAESYLEAAVDNAATRRDLLAFHQQTRRIGGFDYRPDDVTLGRLVGKYWTALAAVEHMVEHIHALKDGVPIDLELSIDEHPNEVPTFDCLTSETELGFVLLEAQRRGIPLTHVAPNFGVEKGTDYRGADGVTGFESRARTLLHIAEDFGVMLDFHSGDDLSAKIRQAIGRATGGRNHFKVSPYLQLLFASVLVDYHPDLFRRWYDDARAYAQRLASAGSTFAVECLRSADASEQGDLAEMAHDEVFHHFSFAFVGRRDADGQFICREEFYELSPAFYRAYQDHVVDYLGRLADDLCIA